VGQLQIKMSKRAKNKMMIQIIMVLRPLNNLKRVVEEQVTRKVEKHQFTINQKLIIISKIIENLQTVWGVERIVLVVGGVKWEIEDNQCKIRPQTKMQLHLKEAALALETNHISPKKILINLIIISSKILLFFQIVEKFLLSYQIDYNLIRINNPNIIILQ